MPQHRLTLLALALALIGCPAEPAQYADPPMRTQTEAAAKQVEADKQAAAEQVTAEQLVPPRAKVEGPRLRVLGIAQDGGLPHIACNCERCEAARADPRRASLVASVAVIGRERGQVWLVDATPDISEQIDMLVDVRKQGHNRVDRHPFAGILLTHAHMGHYVGLAKLGYEAASTTSIPVHASPQMIKFLASNAPWNQLIKLHDIDLRPHKSGERFELGAGLFAESITVPHRDEYTDTVAWYVSGEHKRALYMPDTDPWTKWKVDLDVILADVDLLLLDGTFYSADELPGRNLAEIGHPLMTESMDLLEPRLASGLEVWFVHLNHSNPTLDPAAPERLELEQRGFRIAAAGDEFAL